eukprot:SAG11_NODE_1031_length_6111_cov_2.587159_1_plen_85_part_00
MRAMLRQHDRRTPYVSRVRLRDHTLTLVVLGRGHVQEQMKEAVLIKRVFVCALPSALHSFLKCYRKGGSNGTKKSILRFKDPKS